MKNAIFLTHSAEETFELGYEIGESLKTPTVILLDGELGAGKTVFTKGLAAGLDIDPSDVTSPTFTLVNEHFGRLLLIHLDLYRLPDGVEAAMGIGLGEILLQKAIVVIEWSEKLGNYSITNSYKVKITELSDNDRQIEIQAQHN
ncbi:MAG: tRNA (adenosine(37)-N6)-threonylcarbamoyltransferase complex ATPase subunit type 1 TsaE [Acidobacteria bacterium]|nr:tRNA (adenosine(37)-N6)-threonylcarbamoyltransferase complex ATPase subunit type 1 TsaE [Acidobacteriota bacterium]